MNTNAIPALVRQLHAIRQYTRKHLVSGRGRVGLRLSSNDRHSARTPSALGIHWRPFFTSICLSLAIPSYSQTQTVEIGGSVTSGGVALAFASVGLKGTSYGATTNDQGQFIFSAPPGNYTLRVSHLGYETYQTSIQIMKGSNKSVKVELKEIGTNLDEVTVTAGASEAQRLRETPFSVTSVELTAQKNINVDVAAVLNRVPGLRVRQRGGLGSDMSITLNGMSSLRIFIDGLPADGFGSSMSFNNFPVNIIERIDVYKGVTPVFLGGDVLGGAINIITKKDDVKFVDASYSYGSFNTHEAALAYRSISKNNIAVNATGFFNHSDNDYPVEVQAVLDETNVYQTLEVRRPNNQYTSAGLTLEAGAVNKHWADRLLIGTVVSGNKRGLQGITLTSPPEMHAFQRELSFGPTLKYEKRNLFTKNLDVRVSALYTDVQSDFVDTTATEYYWDGREKPTNYFGRRRCSQ